MRVLVTSGSGRVGRFVVPELEEAGHEVAIFDAVEAESASHRFIKGDLRNSAEVEEAARNAEVYLERAYRTRNMIECRKPSSNGGQTNMGGASDG